MMQSIAAMSMEMHAAQLATSYSLAMTEKAMDIQEIAAQAYEEMLPQVPALGQHIDTYA